MPGAVPQGCRPCRTVAPLLDLGAGSETPLAPLRAPPQPPPHHHCPLGMGAADLPGCTTAPSHLVNTEEQRRISYCTPGPLSSSALPLHAQHDAMCIEGNGEGRQPRPGPQVDTSEREVAGGRLGLMGKDEEREGPSARRNQERLPGRGGI